MKKRRSKLEILQEKLNAVDTKLKALRQERSALVAKLVPLKRWRNAHPQDINLFKKLDRIARYVAGEEQLPFNRLIPLPVPSRYGGLCSWSGVIQLKVREKKDGEWHPATLPDDWVLTVLAHEIAHLKHLDHSPAFKAYLAEIRALVWEAWENYHGLCSRGLMPKAA